MLPLPFRRAVERAVKGSPQAPPIGALMPYAASTAPSGWLLCDGSAVSRTTYDDLFAVISTTYGAGDGATTFNVPNLKGKVVVGFNSTETEFDAMAETGGAKTHTLSTTEIASHTHGTDSQGGHTHTAAAGGDHTHDVGNLGVGGGLPGIPDSGDSGSTGTLVTASAGSHGHSTDSQGGHTHTAGATGGGGAHNNLPPYVVLQYIIKT